MIKINLLPVEFRQVEVRKSQFSARLILIAIFFVILLASLFEFFSFIGTHSKLHRLNMQMTQLNKPSQEADQVGQTINTKLGPEKYFLDRYILPSFLMAETMNTLSDLLPDSMWFSDLSVKRDQGTIRLDLSGYSRITSKQIAVAQIQEYVNAVKAKLEEIFRKTSFAPGSEKETVPSQEVKVVLTTNLRRESSNIEAMQFAVSFRSSLPEMKKA